MMTSLTTEHIRHALKLEDFDAAAAQRLMAPEPRSFNRAKSRPGSPRQASVLLLVYPRQEMLNLVLIQRTLQKNDVHSGQISLPGGAREINESPLETALREVHEELGVLPLEIAILGQLTPLYIPPSDFEVHPFVGSTQIAPQWIPQASEVATILEVPVTWLLDPARKSVEDWQLRDDIMRVPWYAIHEHKVWGATAIILSEFEHRLRHVLNESST